MNSSFSAEDFKSEEPSAEYVQGGYCLLDVGDTLNTIYFVIRKLGWGFSSTVWLCWNTETQSYVAIKLMKGAASFVEITRNEVQLLSITMSGEHPYQQNVVKFLDHFIVGGENGTHACIVFELGGQTLGEFKSKNTLSVKHVKSIVRQILRGLYYLHEVCDLVHSDLKQDNILVLTSENLGQELALEMYEALNSLSVPKEFIGNLPKDKRKIKQPSSILQKSLFETKVREYHRFVQKEMRRLGIVESSAEESTSSSSHHTADWDNAASGDHFQAEEFCSFFRRRMKKRKTNASRELITDKDTNVKIADLGYASRDGVFEFDYIQAREYRAAEVIVGGTLGKAVDIWSTGCIAFELATGKYLFDRNMKDAEHVARITQILGEIPDEVLSQCKHKDLFHDAEGKSLQKGVERISLKEYLSEEFSEEEATEFCDLILSMLNWDVEERFTAGQCLNHPWFEH